MSAPVVLAAVGALVVSLDASLNIALPAIAEAFALDPADMRWIIICYVLTYAFTAFGAGVLADRLGAARVFTAGLGLSGLAFVGYAAAPSFAAVLALRVVQGIGGGLVYGTAPALVTQALPRERHGRGLGVMSLGLGVGLTVGPILGGLIVQTLGWRWIFLYRAPLALGAALAAVLALRMRGSGGPSARMAAPRDVLRLPVLRAAGLAFLANYAQFAVWLLVPFYLVSARGISPIAGGLLFTLMPLATAAAAPVAGWAADRVGARWPALIGLGVEAAGLFLIGRLGAESPIAWAVAGLLLAGLGVGLFQVSNLAEMMAAFPRSQQGVAGGLAFLGRTLGSAVGVQMTAALFAARLQAAGFVGAFDAALLGAAGVAGLAALLAIWPLRQSRRSGPGAL